GRGRLLLQRFGEIRRALPQLIEQPCIFDGDDCLFREIADEIDLLVGERTNLLPIDDDSPHQLIILEHWNTDYGSSTADRSRHTGVWLRSAISADGYLLCPQDAGDHARRIRSKRPPLFLKLHQRGRGTDPSRSMEVVAVVTKERAELGVADL